MSGDRKEDLAVRITERILALPGVRGVFPQHVVAAATLTLVTSARSSASGLVAVDLTGTTAVVTARLATDVTVPATDVIAAVRQAILEEITDLPPHVRIEIAHIE